MMTVHDEHPPPPPSPPQLSCTNSDWVPFVFHPKLLLWTPPSALAVRGDPRRGKPRPFHAGLKATRRFGRPGRCRRGTAVRGGGGGGGWGHHGPRGVGVSEMKRRLLISDPGHFGVTVPYTTRTKRGEEKDGVEYKFVSKPQFEADIIENKFIEHGEYRGHYYGTSLDSVRSILQGNKVCLLDVPPHRIQRLWTAEFKPYVVFVKPPPMEELRLSRRNVTVARRRDGKGSAEPFTEEDFQEMIDSAQEMEDRYGHLFEKTIVNEDMAFAFRELSLALEKLETEIQWIPKSWVPP